jgi:RHS repeat-associated protein
VGGLKSWNVTYANGLSLTNYSETDYDPDWGLTYVSAVGPDGSATLSISQYGQLISVTRYDGSGAYLGDMYGSEDTYGNQISQTLYDYDGQGRQDVATDARNGATTYYFNNNDQVVATLTPSPDGVQGGQLTTNILDSLGRVIQTIQPDGTSVTNAYYPNGLLQETSGSRTYPVAYTYDYAGRMRTMTTWTNFASGGGAAVTTWNYDAYRGLLAGKVYADGKGPSYTYTAGGRLSARTWARTVGGQPLATTYVYDNAGELAGVSYSDATPGVTYGYDRLGRQIAVTNGAMVTSWTYNDANELLTESYTGGPLDGLSVANGYDNLLRRTNLTLNSLPGQSGATTGHLSALSSTAYGYDAASRLLTVSDGHNNAATYSYIANSPLAGNIVFQHNGQTVMTTTKSYDYLNRLTFMGSTPASGVGNGASPLPSFSYSYNTANQRTLVTNVDNSYWAYQYDNLGQVISGKKYWANGTPVAGQQFTYNFDDIGNRKSTASGGDASGANLRPANYSVNNLNQYTSRDIPGYVDVLGSANPNATVTVNLQRAVRQGSYFWDELSENNSSSALWLSLTNLAVLNNGTNADIVATNVGNVFLKQTPEPFSYDADGNLTNDGRWSYTWDAENRLIQMTANTSVGPQFQLNFAYDSQGRRIQKTVATNGVAYSTNDFVYDGWNLVATFNSAFSLQPSALYMWGLDLSGSLQDAGGVGGLLSMTVNSGKNAGTYFYSYDGNGNVTALVNTADGSVAGQWDYDPFGNALRAIGPMAGGNPFLFSTKYYDSEVGLYYYGCRYYDSSTGRWPNRDPIQDLGGLNLYGFLHNRAIDNIDYDGLFLVGPICSCAKDLIKDHLVNNFTKWLDGATACDKLHDYFLNHPDMDLNKGVDVDTDFDYKDQTTVAKTLLGCVFSSMAEKGIEKVVDGVTDETEKKLLKKIAEAGADKSFDKFGDLAKNAVIKTTYRVHGKCNNHNPIIQITLHSEITIGDIKFTTSDEPVMLEADCGNVGCSGLNGLCE